MAFIKTVTTKKIIRSKHWLCLVTQIYTDFCFCKASLVITKKANINDTDFPEIYL